MANCLCAHEEAILDFISRFPEYAATREINIKMTLDLVSYSLGLHIYDKYNEQTTEPMSLFLNLIIAVL